MQKRYRLAAIRQKGNGVKVEPMKRRDLFKAGFSRRLQLAAPSALAGPTRLIAGGFCRAPEAGCSK